MAMVTLPLESDLLTPISPHPPNNTVGKSGDRAQDQLHISLGFGTMRGSFILTPVVNISESLEHCLVFNIH